MPNKNPEKFCYLFYQNPGVELNPNLNLLNVRIPLRLYEISQQFVISGDILGFADTWFR